jgi:hypothetical protein
MSLTGRESEMDRQVIGVHDSVNFARQAPSRATHILVIVDEAIVTGGAGTIDRW